MAIEQEQQIGLEVKPSKNHLHQSPSPSAVIGQSGSPINHYLSSELGNLTSDWAPEQIHFHSISPLVVINSGLPLAGEDMQSCLSEPRKWQII